MEVEPSKNSQSDPRKIPILILGGTGFMGKQLFDDLARHPSSKDLIVYYINRGKKYWQVCLNARNNQAKKQHPQFIHYSGDRSDHHDFTKLVQFLNEKLGISQARPWKAVIDFSSFKWRDLQSATKALKGKTEKYIFISSESIYNTSSEKLTSPVSETDFDINKQYAQMKKMDKKRDKYGYDKMKCEIYLQRTKHVPYICLRLPDVMGPYDNTDRFWCYIKWLQNNSKYSIPLNKGDHQKQLNFVYSVDVAKFIVQLLDIPMEKIPSLAYNLMFTEEPPTLKQFIELMAKHLNVETVSFKETQDKNSNNFYPSTRFGFITSKKAEEELGWTSTSLDQAVRNTVQFFVKKGDNYPDEKRDIEKKFKEDVIQD